MTENPDWTARDTPPPAPSPGPGSGPGTQYRPPYVPPTSPYAYPPGPYQGSYPPAPMPYGDYPGTSVRNGLGVAALVIAVGALITAFLVVPGVVLGVVAVLLGLAGRGRVKRGEATNGGVAMAGVVVGVMAIIAGLAFIAFWVGLFKQVGAGDYFDCLQQAGQDKSKVQECSDRFRESMENRLTVTPTP